VRGKQILFTAAVALGVVVAWDQYKSRQGS
jgi:hypothetical protein